VRDATTGVSKISYTQQFGLTSFADTNVNFMTSTTRIMSLNLSEVSPTVVIDASSDISRGAVRAFDTMAALGVRLDAFYSNVQTIGGAKTFTEDVTVAQDSSNQVTVHANGVVTLQRSSNPFISFNPLSTNLKLQCLDSSGDLHTNGGLTIDGTYKIKGTQIASTDLGDTDDLMRKGGGAFTGDVTVSGDLTIDGTYKINGTQIASTDLGDTDDLMRKGGGAFTGGITVSGDLAIGGTYKVGGRQIASTDLGDTDDLMRKPDIYSAVSNDITINTAMGASTVVFDNTHVFFNTTPDPNFPDAQDLGRKLPQDSGAFYKVKLTMRGDRSSMEGLHAFACTFDFVLYDTTGDGDALPAIVIPVTAFHKWNKHGGAKVVFIPRYDAWEVHLIFDAQSAGYTSDRFNMTIKVKREHW
jgi:hypothetical protein